MALLRKKISQQQFEQLIAVSGLGLQTFNNLIFCHTQQLVVVSGLGLQTCKGVDLAVTHSDLLQCQALASILLTKVDMGKREQGRLVASMSQIERLLFAKEQDFLKQISLKEQLYNLQIHSVHLPSEAKLCTC